MLVLELAYHVQLAVSFDHFPPGSQNSFCLKQLVDLMAVSVHSSLPDLRKRVPLDFSEQLLEPLPLEPPSGMIRASKGVELQPP